MSKLVKAYNKFRAASIGAAVTLLAPVLAHAQGGTDPLADALTSVQGFQGKFGSYSTVFLGITAGVTACAIGIKWIRKARSAA